MDRESGVIAAEFNERVIDFYAQDASKLLTHAYAISIDKSQGAEYPVVVIVLLKDHYLLLHRQLLYTAVTRAKQACVRVTDWKAIGMAVRNSQPTMRNSGLAERLRQEARQPVQTALNTAPR